VREFAPIGHDLVSVDSGAVVFAVPAQPHPKQCPSIALLWVFCFHPPTPEVTEHLHYRWAVSGILIILPKRRLESFADKFDGDGRQRMLPAGPYSFVGYAENLCALRR